MQDVKSRDRVETIDVMRGIAALMVTWWHLFDPAVRYLNSDVLQAVATASARNGASGVYMFFVISGFVIPMAGVGGGRSIAFWSAIAKRMVRLYPPFLVSVLFAVGLMLAAAHMPGFAGRQPEVSAWQVFANASYLAPYVGVEWINPVFWTLLIEVQYYFLIYAVLRQMGSLPPQCLLIGTTIAALFPLTIHSFSVIFDFTEFFATGFLAFLIVDGRISRLQGVAAIGVALIVALLDQGVVVMLLAGVAAWFCTVRGVAPKVLVWLGTISYSLYLTHFFVATKAFRFFTRYLGSNDAGIIASYALSLLACIVVAYVFYYLIERPAIRWSHQISARRRAT